jgi:hypothetical protein
MADTHGLTLPTVPEGASLLTLTATPVSDGTRIAFRVHPGVVAWLATQARRDDTGATETAPTRPYGEHDQTGIQSGDHLGLEVWRIPYGSDGIPYHARPNLRLDTDALEQWPSHLPFLRFTVESPSRTLILPTLDPDLWIPSSHGDPDSPPRFARRIEQSMLGLIELGVERIDSLSLDLTYRLEVA